MQNEEKIYAKSDEFFKDLIESINHCQKSIQFQMYIFELSSFGVSVLSSLVNASQRGVRVELLLDGVGSAHWSFSDLVAWREKGIYLYFFHPLPWQRHSFQLWKWLRLRKIAVALFRVNHRNHRKICVLDDKDIFLGSANVADVHLESVKGKEAWRDTGIFVRAEHHPHLLSLYPEALKLSRHHYGKMWGAVRRKKKQEHLQLIGRIKTAKKRVWITNPYFVPNLKLIRALCRASQNGIDVKLLVPKRIDIIGLKFAIEALYHLLLKCQVEVYEYLPSMLHAKIFICDDLVSIGSSNLDYRSIFYNLEADAIVSNTDNVRLVEEQFLQDLSFSYKIDHEHWKKRSFLNRLLEKAFFLIKEIL